jgi:hypothetical protein
VKSVEKTRSRFEKLDLNPNRFQGGKKWYNMVEGGRRQHNISKGLGRAIGLIRKAKNKLKKERKKEREGRKEEWSIPPPHRSSFFYL